MLSDEQLDNLKIKTFYFYFTEQEKYIEFFNPKIRRELEKKDEEYKKTYGYKGAAPGGDDWTWLTNYCRIPVRIINFYKCVGHTHLLCSKAIRLMIMEIIILIG